MEINEKIKVEIRNKEQFFACMSHELRNPLNSLLGSVEVISCTKMIDMDILNSAQLCGETLLNLIGNILDFIKVQSGKMDIYASPTDLYERILNSMKMFTNLAQKKNIYLKYQGDEQLPPALLIDAHKLNQVLVNLIGNSIKFTENGGIHIKVEWYPIYADISTSQIQAMLDNILLYSSREDLKNFAEKMDLEDENHPMPSDMEKYIYIFKNSSKLNLEQELNLNIKDSCSARKLRSFQIMYAYIYYLLYIIIN